MAILSTYSSEDVQITVGGVTISGAADASFCTVARTSDTWSMKIGSGGEVARSKNPDRSGRITLRLLSTSDSNDYLSGLFLADDLSNSGIVPVMIKDGNGTSLFTAPQAWVVKPADADFDKEANEREWMLDCAELISFVGGNT